MKKKKRLIVKEKHSVQKEVPVVHVKDIDDFILEVVRQRQLPNTESLLLKVGLDEGQKMMKICLSVIHLLGEQDQAKKRFEEGFKDSGVKKVMMLAVTPAKEMYENLKVLLDLIKCSSTRLRLRYSADFKCIALLCGIGAASSTHPCPFCNWKYGDGFKHAALRTFRMIIDQYEAWMASGGKQCDIKHYYNCKNNPLPVFTDPECLVLTVFCLPVLHIMQGLVNTLFKAIEAFFPGIAAWPKRLHLKREDYHGKIYKVRASSFFFFP